MYIYLLHFTSFHFPFPSYRFSFPEFVQLHPLGKCPPSPRFTHFSFFFSSRVNRRHWPSSRLPSENGPIEVLSKSVTRSPTFEQHLRIWCFLPSRSSNSRTCGSFTLSCPSMHLQKKKKKMETEMEMVNTEEEKKERKHSLV